MRICLYTETALPKIGGHEMAVDALARQFLHLGHEVVVLAPRPRRPLRADDTSLPYRVMRHPRFLSTRRLVSWYRWWLLRLQRRFPFDVLHCQGIYPPGYLASLCRRRLNVPVVITSQGGDLNPANVRLARPVLYARHVQALQTADALVSISGFTRKGYLRLLPTAHRILDIPNGVDLEAFSRPAARPEGLDRAIQAGAYALFLGRLKRRKGVDLLLEALAKTPGNGAVQLVIAGDGEERPALEAQAARLGISGRLRFVGTALGEKKTYLLQNALCTVMPTRGWEGMPLVALESYGAGVPVLATRVPGLQEVIVPHETGWLVPPEMPIALAEVLRLALGQRALTQRLGERARIMARRYSWHAIAEQHVALYEELLRSSELPEPLAV
jgi:glycosyltransferase involved in cell wall biosynthesis